MHSRRGFSLVQAIVVLVFLAVGLGVAITLISRQRENALRVQCTLSLKRHGDAIHAYHDKSRALPPSRIADGYATWLVFVAPYMQKDSPLTRWDLERQYSAQADEVRESRMPSQFCPARRRSETLSEAGDLDTNGKHYPGGLGDYASVAGDGSKDDGDNGAIVPAINVERQGDRVVKWKSLTGLASLSRGQEYTFLIGEKHVTPSGLGDAQRGDGAIYNGGQPANFARVAGVGFPLVPDVDLEDKTRFGSWHRGVCHFLFADTGVRAMTPATSEFVLATFARRGK